MLAPGAPDFLGGERHIEIVHPVRDRVSNTALTTAAGAGAVVTDPMPFTPSGWVGEGVDTVCRSNFGMALARSGAYSIKLAVRKMRNDIYFAHYYSRLKKIFDNREYGFALALLEQLAREEACTLQHIRDLAHTHNLENYAIVLRTLAFDGYIFASATDGDTHYRFTSPVLRLWWGNYVR